MIIYVRHQKTIININLVIHRKDKIYQNLISTKINNKTKHNLNICFFLSVRIEK